MSKCENIEIPVWVFRHPGVSPNPHMFQVRVSTCTRMGVGFVGTGVGWTAWTCARPVCHPSYEVDSSFSFLYFYLTLSLRIYTYKDRSLQSVVHRPYSGLTFRLIFFLPIFTSVDCLVATGEHRLISFGLVRTHALPYLFLVTSRPLHCPLHF